MAKVEKDAAAAAARAAAKAEKEAANKAKKDAKAKAKANKEAAARAAKDASRELKESAIETSEREKRTSMFDAVGAKEASGVAAKDASGTSSTLSEDKKKLAKRAATVLSGNPGNLCAKHLATLSKSGSISSAEVLSRLEKCCLTGLENPDSGLGCYAMAPQDYDDLAFFFDPVRSWGHYSYCDMI